MGGDRAAWVHFPAPYSGGKRCRGPGPPSGREHRAGITRGRSPVLWGLLAVVTAFKVRKTSEAPPCRLSPPPLQPGIRFSWRPWQHGLLGAFSVDPVTRRTDVGVGQVQVGLRSPDLSPEDVPAAPASCAVTVHRPWLAGGPGRCALHARKRWLRDGQATLEPVSFCASPGRRQSPTVPMKCRPWDGAWKECARPPLGGGCPRPSQSDGPKECGSRAHGQHPQPLPPSEEAAVVPLAVCLTGGPAGKQSWFCCSSRCGLTLGLRLGGPPAERAGLMGHRHHVAQPPHTRAACHQRQHRGR